MSEKEQPSIMIPCDCHCHYLQFSEIDLGDGLWEIAICPAYIGGGRAEFMSLWERLTACVKILRKGKHALGHEFLIDRPGRAKVIVDYLNNFIDKCDQSKPDCGSSYYYEEKNADK